MKIKRGMVLELPFHESSETARKKAVVWRRSEARYLQDVRKNEESSKKKRKKEKGPNVKMEKTKKATRKQTSFFVLYRL